MVKGPKDQAVSERPPVARVAVDISLAHLDRPFDYLVPASLDQAAVPGCRVRVRFAGQLVDGYLLERTQTSEHQGRLARLERVISPEPVLTPEIFDLARAVADRYAGTLADVLRLAIPPRHATAEREAPAAGTAARPGARNQPDPGPWVRYPAGAAFLAGLAEGRPVRAAWSALPGPEWPAEIAIAAATTAAAGRGVVIVVPDARDLDRVDAALTAAGARTTCASPRTSARPSATAAGWPCAGAWSRWWRAPGPRCSPRSPSSAWSCSGTTATTCTPSPARRTRTPVRCSPCARTGPARPRSSAASPAPPSSLSWSRAAGPGRWPAVRRPCGRQRRRSGPRPMRPNWPGTLRP